MAQRDNMASLFSELGTTSTCTVQTQLHKINGVLAEIHSETDLTKSSSSPSIPLDKWRTSSRIALRVALNDLQEYKCKGPLTDKVTIELTDLNDSPFKEKTHTQTVWISKALKGYKYLH